MTTRNLSRSGSMEQAASFYGEGSPEIAQPHTYKASEPLGVRFDEGRTSNHAPDAAGLVLETIEITTALLANGAACQNWLCSPYPDMERARLSLDRIIRDAQELSQIILKLRSNPSMSAPPRA